MEVMEKVEKAQEQLMDDLFERIEKNVVRKDLMR